MNIKLYQYVADRRILDKSSLLDNETNLTGRLVQEKETSFLNPIIEIQYNIDLITSLFNYNYAYVEDFARYYFIEDITVLTTGLARLYLKVDVLYTNINFIKPMRYFMSRTENKGITNIPDNEMSISQIPITTDLTSDIDFTNHLFYDNEFTPTQIWAQQCVVITYANDKYDLDTPNFSILPTIPIINQSMCGVANTNRLICSPSFLASYLATNLFIDDVFKSYIKNIVIYPFDLKQIFDTWLTKVDEQHPLHIGTKDVNYGEYEIYHFNGPTQLAIPYCNFTLPNVDNDYLKCSPYTKYFCYMPFYQEFEVDAYYSSGFNKVYYLIDLETNTNTIYMYNKNRNKIILNENCNIGIQVQLDSTQTREYNASIRSAQLNGIMQVLAGGLLATTSPIGVITGGASILSGITNIGKSFAPDMLGIYNKASCGGVSATNSLALPRNPYMYKVEYKPLITRESDDYITYKFLKGLPTNKIYAIEDIDGYCKCENVVIRSFGGNISSSEQDEIKQILESGFWTK